MGRRLAGLLVVLSLVGSACSTGPGDVTVAPLAGEPSTVSSAVDSAEAETVDEAQSVTVEFSRGEQEQAASPSGTIVARAAVPFVTARVSPDDDADVSVVGSETV